MARSFPAHLGTPNEPVGSGPQTCPLHSSRTATLWLLNDGLAGPYFRCLHSDCHFVGTPADLLRAVRKLSVRESLAAFGGGGEFEGYFGQAVGAAIIQAKLKPATDQDDLRTYLKECRQLLRLHGQNVLMPLQSEGILPNYLLGTQCGMASPKLPAVLNMLSDTEYIKNDLLLIPYFSGPYVTHLATYNPLTGQTEHCPIQDDLPGIFMERELSWPEVSQVILCNNELDALAIYSSAQTLSSVPVNPIVVSDYRALLNLPDLKRVELLTHPRSPLKLGEVLRCWRTLHNRGMRLQILDLVEPPSKTKAAVFLNHEKLLLDIWPWVANQIQGCYKEGRDALIRVLSTATLGDLDREFLLAELKRRENVDPGLIETVEYVKSAITDRAINNCLVRRDSQGYHLLLPRHESLTNFALYTTRFVVNPANEVNAHCRVQVDGQLFPGEVKLPAKLLHSGNRRLKHIVWQQLSVANKEVPINLRSVPLPGFDWLDLLQAFDSPEFCCGISQLGSKEGRINFPNFYLEAKNFSINPQRTGVFVNENTQQLYNALKEDGDLNDYRQLFASDHPAAVGIAGALAHIIHHFVARTSANRKLSPKHFIFATSSEDPSLWETSFRQLCSIFMATPPSSEIKPIPEFKKQVADYDALGDLPLFCRIKGSGAKIDNWLSSCNYPVIALADDEASQSLGQLLNTAVTAWDQQAFVTAEPAQLEPEVITKLQRGWLPFLATCLREFRAKDEELCSAVPAAVAYAWICNFFDIKQNASVISMFTQYSIIERPSVTSIFFASICKLLSKTYVVSPTERLGKNNPQSLGWRTPGSDVVIRGSRAVRHINALLGCWPLNLDDVENALVGVDLATVKSGPLHLWQFTPDVWNTHVLPRTGNKYTIPLLKLAEYDS